MSAGFDRKYRDIVKRFFDTLASEKVRLEGIMKKHVSIINRLYREERYSEMYKFLELYYKLYAEMIGIVAKYRDAFVTPGVDIKNVEALLTDVEKIVEATKKNVAVTLEQDPDE